MAPIEIEEKMILDKIIAQYEKENPAKKMFITLMAAAIILLGIYSHAQHGALKRNIREIEHIQQRLVDIQTELDEIKPQENTKEYSETI